MASAQVGLPLGQRVGPAQIEGRHGLTEDACLGDGVPQLSQVDPGPDGQ